MSQYDVVGFYQFLSQTPEQGLRKMLVDQKTFTEAHFTMLQKIVRSGESAFCAHFEAKDFPKVKFGPAEQKLKDKFWEDCVSACKSRGVLQPGTAGKAA